MEFQYEGRFRETERRTGFGNESDSYRSDQGPSSDAGQVCGVCVCLLRAMGRAPCVDKPTSSRA